MTHITQPDDRSESRDEPYRTTYDPRTDSVTEELVRAVATVHDLDPTELAPLANFVDPDALDALFAPRRNGVPRDGGGSVEFDYADLHVRVEEDGEITIRHLEPDGETDFDSPSGLRRRDSVADRRDDSSQ